MGKGDKKTRRGKIILGTYGKLRPRRRKFSLQPKTTKGTAKK
ncbi:30S ribosomal protein THX [Constantimarinum furrinae]|nr:30S ribosomal protein THX [Constantimarinum furrinae]